ncbi:MAG: efflux RND transporter periplasmic adaptor subunit [Planctomycetota bacterium]|nr:efflux RND transporter periplasmic adaptor subunit [Planctomycetota bacterium]
MTIRLALSLSVLLSGALDVAAQQGPAPVAVSQVQLLDVDAVQTYVGTVTASRSSSIGSAVDGRVLQFPINEGDFVTQGQPLAQLLTETINLEVEAAQAELLLQKHELAELENGSRPEELAAAEARKRAAKAFHDFRLTQLGRAKSLFEKGAFNEEELHEIEAEAEAAVQVFRQGEENWKLVAAGPRQERILQARARVAMQDAVVRNLQSRVRKYTIVAPFDGFIVAEHTETGEWLKQGDLVADVVALGEVDVLVHILEQHVTHIGIGTDVRVEIPALHDLQITGTVASIIPQADIRARTFPVKVRVRNSIVNNFATIKAGMLARAIVPIGTRRKGLLIPKDALVLGGPSPTIFVVDTAASAASEDTGVKNSTNSTAKTGKVRPVPVTMGASDGRLIEIQGAIKAGDMIVVRGNERLRPGQDVVITETLDPRAEPRAKAVGR